MSNFRPRHLQKRALLTETLPAEVPLIFSNNNLFASTLPLKTRDDTKAALANLRSLVASHSIPLDYTIRKGRDSTRSLSIVHPHVQLEMAQFYDDFAETILAYTDKSSFSIRRPSSIVSSYSADALEAERTPKDGIPHDLLLEPGTDYSNITSFFRYERYNLLGKFIDSSEFVRLESRFPRLRVLDVSKCFYNMYTHSIAWAVKGKPYSKAHRGSFSFEAEFDRLMQRSNYSETNGIVVGPELSRIFAEVILQDVDKRIIDELGQRYEHNQDYAVRRYIDDFYVFGKSSEQIDYIQDVISRHIGFFKLYFNAQKTITTSRPFVTDLTLAKSALADVIEPVVSDLRAALETSDMQLLGQIRHRVEQRIRRLREVVAQNKVSVSQVSGWLLATLRRELRSCLCLFRLEEVDVNREALVQIISSIYQVAFYICSVDLRVRTTFSVTYLLLLARRELHGSSTEEAEWLLNFLFEHHLDLTTAFWRELKESGPDCANSVELSNMLTGGAYIFEQRFADHGRVYQILEWLSAQNVTYLSYITQKYVMLRNSAKFGSELKRLNDRIESWIKTDRQVLASDTEMFLLLSDYLSAPDITTSKRLAFLKSILGGNLSGEGMSELARFVGFVDWDGVSMEHVLERHHLRPTYSTM